jgi:hypothetical protein
MRWCRISCDILFRYISLNSSKFKGEQNNKRITKIFLNLFASWSIHVARMHVCHYASSYNNPNALQATWNIRCSMSSTIERCSKEVAFDTTISRRRKKKHSPTTGCTKYIRPTTFSPRCQAGQTFSRIFQTWSTVSQPHFGQVWGWNSHSQSWGFGVLRDSQIFRVRQQRGKHLALGCFWCHWKGLEV